MSEYVRLDDACVLNMGQSPDSSSYNENCEGLPFFQGNADFGDMYPEVRIWCSTPTKIVEENTLLISVRAPIGALNFSNTKSCIGRGLAGLTPLEEFDLKYIYYCLMGKHAELNEKGTGSTFKAISKNALGETLVRKIDKKKQLEIVEILDKTYGVICNRKQELDQLDLLIKARFVEMFGDIKFNPKGWEKCTFDDITSKITDGEHGTVPRVEESEGHLYFMARNITKDGTIDLTETSYVPDNVHEKIYKRCNPKAGDLLLVCVGATIGKSTIVPDDMDEFSMARSVALLKPDREKINNVFLSNLLKSDAIQNDISNCAHAAAQAGLYTNMIKSLDAFIPPMELQKQFAGFVKQVDKSKVVEYTAIR